MDVNCRSRLAGDPCTTVHQDGRLRWQASSYRTVLQTYNILSLQPLLPFDHRIFNLLAFGQ
ncbi:hypothetical protein QF012_000624 [Pseudomonas laurylsulfatiphila]